MKVIALFVCFVLLASCQSSKIVSENSTPSMGVLSRESLSKDMAASRSQQIQNVEYELYLELNNEEDIFRGEQKISFTLNHLEHDVHLDFQGGNILSARVNGEKVQLSRGPVFVEILKSNLQFGENLVEIQFSHPYSRSGAGLHRFRDPEDDRVYLYTDFEPFDANRMAPFFDQPDLKAPLLLKVKAPADWVVVGNAKVKSVEKILSSNNFHNAQNLRHPRDAKGTQYKIWQFEKTKPISTYVYGVMAGPFKSWSDQYKNIPLKIYSRKSLARHVPYKDWFKATKIGFAYFEKFFGIDYPFYKYDQLIVPEFSAGAMENVGAVTFSERYISRGAYTRTQRLRIYNVILHEMAHMWFGNLVTMKWWDDLWLNESFATYMATRAQVEATEFKEAWGDFHADKAAAYRQDQMVTTHPVAGEVTSSDEAFSNFDDITYGKGASVLKELNHFIGPDLFQAAVREYFQTHKYKNTTLQDFVAAFAKVTGSEIQTWFRSWLETTGVDTVRVSFTCDAKYLKIKLDLPAQARPHAMNIGIYQFDAMKLLKKTGEVKMMTEASITASVVTRDLPRIQKETCPQFIYPNDGDHAYIKVEFDALGVDFILRNMNAVLDAKLRMLLWSNLWTMVRDQKIKLSDFSDLALATLQTERDLDILNFLAEKTVGHKWGEFDSLYYFWPRQIFGEKDDDVTMASQYEKVLFQRFKNEKNRDLRDVFLNGYLTSVRSQGGVQRAYSLLLEIQDPDQRWRALGVICRNHKKHKDRSLNLNLEELVSKELHSDKSERGYKSALQCRASVPDPFVKSDFLAKMGTLNVNYSSDELEQLARALFSADQREMIKSHSDTIYNLMRSVWSEWEEGLQYEMASGLAPTYCDRAGNEKLKRFLESDDRAHRLIPSAMKSALMERWDEDRRCVLIREYNR